MSSTSSLLSDQKDLVAAAGGEGGERLGGVAFARSGWSDEEHVLALVDELERRELEHFALGKAGGGPESV